MIHIEVASHFNEDAFSYGLALGLADRLRAELGDVRCDAHGEEPTIRLSTQGFAETLNDITVEVTESAAMHDPEAAASALESFRKLGVGISMDDYGTGHSTLSYLKLLPLNELKIDRSFVQHAHLNRGDAVLARSTIDLAHDLGLKVVAEGVEEPGCLAYLRSIGCDMAQGHLISRPIPAADLVRRLGQQAAQAA